MILSSGRLAAPVIFAFLIVGTVLFAAASEASAQGRLDAKYEASLAGIQIGKGGWVVDVADDQFQASVTAGSAGLLKSIGSGTGSGASNGRVVGGQLVPVNYVSTINYGKRVAETIRITLSGGNVKESSIDPEPPVNPDRIPVTEAQRHNVVDPMTSSLLRVPGTGDPMTPDACRGKTVSVFDGRLRYDLKLDFKRMERVKAEKGYQGPALACAVYFVPVAGYVPDRYAIKYLTEQRGMEIWFVPIAGTRVLVPFKIVIPTPLGTGTIEATEFVTTQRTAKTN